MKAIEARRAVHAPPEPIFDFLSRLENHWTLADRWIRVLQLDPPPTAGSGADAGWVRLRGPLGISRRVRTMVLAAEPPEGMSGSAEIAGGTRARIRWELAPVNASTTVTLRAEIESLGPLDRILFALGARLWLRRRFGSVLDALERRLAAQLPQSELASQRQ